MKDVGCLPRFPYGGTNRIRFKGYNLSRMAPPSKMLIKLSGLFPTKIFCNCLHNLLQIYNNYANLQQLLFLHKLNLVHLRPVFACNIDISCGRIVGNSVKDICARSSQRRRQQTSAIHATFYISSCRIYD